MIRTVLFLLLACCAQSAFAQKDPEIKAIKLVINQFFEGMEKRDTVLLKSTCTETPVFQSFMKNKAGEMLVYTDDFADFVKFVGTPGDDQYKEEIKFDAIHYEQSLAVVWAPYVFYLNGKISHRGTDSFQLVKTAAGWKIQYIIDTRRK